MKISEIKELWGPRKKYEIYFADFPDANKLLDSIPILLDRIDKLESALRWYAESGSYERVFEDDLGYKSNPEEWIYSEPEVLEDGGARAREALE